jgi:outer membrane receptor protein involved in Fe transport
VPIRASRLFSLLLAAILIAFAFSGAVVAQTIDLSAVKGRVLDPQGKSIAGAEVTLRNADTGLTKAAKTNQEGDYSFAGLPINDNYSVKTQVSGFKPAEQQNIVLRANQAAVVNFTLDVSGEQSQITVYGTPGSVTVDNDQVTTRFDVQKIEETPILNRKITAIPLLDSATRQAQTTGDLFINEVLFVINGTGRRQTTYDLDNTDANDSWGRQTMFAAIPFSAVQELNVDKNSVSSEYGRNAGTAVDVVTKSGSNQWHGDFIGMGRPQFSEAKQPPAAKPAFNTLAQGSAMISGPIVKDKTFFLASYEYSNQNRDAVITSPIDPGAIYSGTFSQNLFFGRIDHQFSQNNLLTIRGNFDRFTDTNPSDAVSGVNLPTTARTFARYTYQGALIDTATLSPNLVNEARFEYLLGSPITQFLPVTQATQEFISGVYTNGESRIANLMNHQYQWADTLSISKGKHQIKTGLDVVYSSSGGYGTEFGSGYLQGRFQINSAYANIPISTLLTYNPGLPPPGSPAKSPALSSAFTQSFGTATYNEKETLLGAFVQDNWRMTPNLVVNLGLRYDLQTLTQGNTNFSPRVGLAYTLFGGDKPTVLRAGYGIYYTELPANIVANSSINGPQGVYTYTVQPGQFGFPTTFSPITNIPPGTVLPARDVQILAGQCNYLNQFLPISQLHFCPNKLLNPYTQQWNFGIEQQLSKDWVLTMDYIGSHTIHINQPIDLNSPSGLTRTKPGQVRTATAANATRPIVPVPGGYRQVLAYMNLGTSFYDGLQVGLKKQFSTHFALLASYTWSHTIDTVEWDGTGQNPNDYSCAVTCEKARSQLNQTHRASFSGTYSFPYGFTLGGYAFLGSGYPYNALTGVDNNGDGNNSDRPVVGQGVVPRNWATAPNIYNLASSLQKNFKIKERMGLNLRAEVYNFLNTRIYYSLNGTYGNAALPASTFSAPVGGIANVGAPRQMQFLAQIVF